MKNFDWTTFTRKIAIKAKMPAIYNAWAVPIEIEKWFLSRADYFDIANNLIKKEDPIQKNYKYEWSWYLWEGVEKGVITRANGVDLIEFSFADTCVVRVQFSKLMGYTIVELTQSNIPTDDESKVNIRMGCHTGWSFYLVNLKSVYEGGLDLRNKTSELLGMINN